MRIAGKSCERRTHAYREEINSERKREVWESRVRRERVKESQRESKRVKESQRDTQRHTKTHKDTQRHTDTQRGQSMALCVLTAQILSLLLDYLETHGAYVCGSGGLTIL